MPTPVSQATFISSSSLEIGTWVAYTVGSEEAPTEVLFVNHSDAETSIAVSVDVANDKVKVLSAPPDGSGGPLVAALISDLSDYVAVDAGSGAVGSVAPKDFTQVTVNVAKRLFAKAAAKLTKPTTGEALERAVKEYTGAGYRSLTPFLREGVVPASWTKQDGKEKARTLVHAIDALPPMVNGETRRRFSVGMNGDSEKLATFVSTLKPGAVYKDRGFMSTTLNTTAPSVAGAPTFRFDIKGASGRDISMLSNYPSEKEVLFTPKTKFRIKSVKGEFIPATYSRTCQQWTDFVAATSEEVSGNGDA